MVRPLVWVLAGIILYTVVAMALRARQLIPSYIRVQGPITTVHTKRGRALLDRLAAPRRFWRAWGNFGVGMALVVMIGSFLMVLFAGIRALDQPQRTPVQNPQNVLVIPGVNEFLPLAAAPEIVFGLLVGLVVHEGGHGLLCRVEDIEIDSMGLALFTLIPLGAFVEPDEESRNMANRGSQTRMFAAGVTNNFAITLIAFLLLFGPVIGSVSVADGVPVGRSLPGSSAEAAGIEQGDRITAVAGTPVSNQTELDAVLRDTDASSVQVELNGERTITVERSLMMTRALGSVIDGRTEGEGIEWTAEDPPIITAVNGTSVTTEQQFRHAVANHTVARIETDAGTATMPTGAFVSRINEDGPLAAAGAPQETSMILTRVDGERIVDMEALSDVLAAREEGDRVTVEAYVEGERRTYNVTLADHPREDGAFIGVFLQPGVSGLGVDDFGIGVYPAEAFLRLLGGGEGLFGGLTEGPVTQQIVAVLVLPFLGAIDPSISYNFAGFISPIANFYTAEGGPLAFMGGGLLALANVLFWTGWINLQLGLFNCIPAFPLDGGHILRTSTEAIISRLPVEGGRTLTSVVTVSITLTMIAGLFLMVFGPQLTAG